MRKCLTLIANTKVWKSVDVVLKDKETKVFQFDKPKNIFEEDDVYFEKWVANNEYEDNSFHCIVELVDKEGRPVSFFEKTLIK